MNNLLSELKEYNSVNRILEVLTVITIFAAFFAIIALAVKPGENFSLARDVQRENDVLQLSNAIYRYFADNNTVQSLEEKAGVILRCSEGFSDIGSAPGNIDLERLLVDKYVIYIPVDPETMCNNLDTCYDICISDSNNRIKIIAPNAETKEIEIFR